MHAHSLPKPYFVLLLVLSLLLASCASSASPQLVGERALGVTDSGSGAVPAAPVEAPAYATGNKVDQSSAQPIERMVIKNASLSIAVDDPSASMDRISSLAEEMGGYVVSANVYQTYLSDGQKVPQGTITVRVPADRLQEAMTRIKAETKLPVINENISSQDITSEYTDLDSRVRNLEAAEKQLQGILDRATKTEDVLNVFNQLTQVREQIEVIKGQMKYYEQSAALSAISVELIPNASVQPVTIGGWQPQGVARDAVQALVNTLKGLATVGIWLVIYLLPTLLVVFGPPVLIIFFIVRWLRRRKKATQKPAAV